MRTLLFTVSVAAAVGIWAANSFHQVAQYGSLEAFPPEQADVVELTVNPEELPGQKSNTF